MSNLSVLITKDLTFGNGEPTTGCFPDPKTLTGTIQHDHTTNRVYGTGTSFQTQVFAGDYLFNSGSGDLFECRLVKSVSQNAASQVLFLSSPFTRDITAGTILVITKAAYFQVDIYNDGGGDVYIDGKILTSTEHKMTLGYLSQKRVVKPFGYDFQGCTGKIIAQQ